MKQVFSGRNQGELARVANVEKYDDGGGWVLGSEFWFKEP